MLCVCVCVRARARSRFLLWILAHASFVNYRVAVCKVVVLRGYSSYKSFQVCLCKLCVFVGVGRFLGGFSFHELGLRSVWPPREVPNARP